VRQRGQSTVEMALCLPILCLLIACALDVGQVALDQARLWHAAREAARVAAVDPDGLGIRRVVREAGVEGARITVAPGTEYRVQGEPVTVVLRRRGSARVPLMRPLLASLTLQARATFRIEQP
jgi:uncharacterized membrane protein